MKINGKEMHNGDEYCIGQKRYTFRSAADQYTPGTIVWELYDQDGNYCYLSDIIMDLLRSSPYDIPDDPDESNLVDKSVGYNGVPVEGGVNHCEWNDKGVCRHPIISNGKDSLRRNFNSKRNCSLTIFGVDKCSGFLPAR